AFPSLARRQGRLAKKCSTQNTTASVRRFPRYRLSCTGPSHLLPKAVQMLSTSDGVESRHRLARNYSLPNLHLVDLDVAHIQPTRRGRGSGGSSVLRRQSLEKLDMDFAKFCPILPDRSQPTGDGCREVAVHSCTIGKRR